ncbi:hypothetical protein ACWG5P_17000 [Streptomyces prasinus]
MKVTGTGTVPPKSRNVTWTRRGTQRVTGLWNARPPAPGPGRRSPPEDTT